MLPKGLVVTALVLPVRVHVAKDIGCASLKNGSDVGVCTSGVAVGTEGTIAVIGPMERSRKQGVEILISRETYQRPWIVHESVGPVTGSVSQNCVCKSCPPGALKQQVSATAVVLWQDNTVLLVMGQLGGPATALEARRPAPTAALVKDLNEGMMIEAGM